MPRKPTDPIDKHVGARVKMRRIMLGMSQEQLGDALGITFQQVQKYERGTNRISASRLQHTARILQVPVAFFFEDAPSAALLVKSTEVASPTYVDDFLATSDGLTLARAFTSIADTKVRRRIVDLVGQIAGTPRMVGRRVS